MKKLNNRGFLLSETLITTCIIATLATSLYIYISKLIDNYEKRDNYDNVVDVYKLNNYKIFFENYDGSDTTITQIKTMANDSCIYSNLISASLDIISKFGYVQDESMLFVCKGNFKENFYINNFVKDDFEFQEYIRLLPNDLENDEMMIIGKFEGSQKRKASYASIKMKEMK